MSSFDMTPVSTSLYDSAYASYSSTALTTTVQNIGVKKQQMERKKAKGSASHMPHPWMLTLIEWLYNDVSYKKNWLSRELGSSNFAQTYADVWAAGKGMTKSTLEHLLDLFLTNVQGVKDKYTPIIQQLKDRIRSPSDYPLVGWPNGFVHGFENADITVIVALFYDLDPPEEWAWKPTLESLVSALYDSHSPNGSWKDRTRENFDNGTFVPDSLHEIPMRSKTGVKIELNLRFQLKNAASSPMSPVSMYDSAYWADNVCKYVQNGYEEDPTGGFGFTSMSQKQLLDGFRNVAEEMRIGSVYAYQLRFFMNSFVPPKTWILHEGAGRDFNKNALQSVPELSDKDYIDEAVREFGDEQRKSMTPMPEIFDEVMAEEPPTAPPVPAQLATVPVQPFIPTADTAKYMVAQATFIPVVPPQPVAMPTAQKRPYEEIPNLKHIRQEYSTSGAASMLSKLEGSGMYKGSALANPKDETAAVVRVNHGMMKYTDGFMGSLEGTMYDGGWKNNLWHGHGVLHFPGHHPIIPLSMPENTPCIYDGNFSDGQFDGVGRLYLLALGQSWEGMWKDGKRTSHTSRMSFPPKAASHWATTRQLIGIWPQDFDEFVDVAKYAYNRGIQLTTDLPIQGAAQTVLVQLPHFETDIHTPNGGGIVLRASTADAYVAISEFFRASNPLWLGWGADAKFYSKYNFIVPVATFDIDYSTHKMFHDHKTAMGVMGVNRRVKSSQKMLEDIPSLKGVLDVETCTRIGEFLKKLNSNIFSRNETPLVSEQNEQFLFHGGPWSAIWSILQTGFDEKRASNGLYGRGCYFAEDPGKCDQYAGNDYRRPMTQTERKYVQDHFGISDQQIADAVVNKDGDQDIFCILMCRVVLGSTIHRSLQEFGTNRTGPAGAAVKVQHGKNKGQDEPLFYGDDGKPMPFDTPDGMRTAQTLNRVFNSIVGKQEIGTHTSNKYRYREFITYKGIIARPTQLIFYKRVKKDLPSNYTWTDAYACP